MGDLIRVRVVRTRMSQLTHEQLGRGREAVREIRLGVSWNFAPVLLAARQMHQALHQTEAHFLPQQLDDTIAQASLDRLLETLERDFELGRLLVTEGAMPLLGIAPELELTVRVQPLDPPPLPAIARPPPPDKLTLFDVRFVDEIGQGIGGLEVEFTAGARVETVTTNPIGAALLEDVASMSASIGVVSSEALGEILEPRWDKPRVGSPPTGVNTKTFAFTGEDIAGVPLKPAVPNTVVITPVLGKLFIELWDKTARVRHVEQSYEITGPESFSGKTDDKGRLVHEEVTRGDYKLALTVELDLGDGTTVSDTYDSPLVVLEAAAGEPEVRMLGVVPRVVMARMRGMLFDTNKSFLLPTARDSLARLRRLYEANNPSQLLIVGHTDTTSEPAINDPLSEARAESVHQYLIEDVDGWLKNYDSDQKSKKWGNREDRLMMLTVDGWSERPPEQNVIEWYQERHNLLVDSGAKAGEDKLDVDGEAGPKTRRALITHYMSLDSMRLEERKDLQIEIETLGCGENFPLDATGEDVDERSPDERDAERDRVDRRVEFFFFDNEFGIAPPASGPDGKEYLTWRERAELEQDDVIDGIQNEAVILPITDAHFRTGSAVMLPEGSAPAGDADEALTSVGALATALRFNEEHEGRKMLVAGHTDAVGGPTENKTLSEERAELVHAVLMGGEDGRETFKRIASKTGLVSDWKQILKWSSVALAEVPPLEVVAVDGASSDTETPLGESDSDADTTDKASFTEADPGVVDDNAFTGIEPLKNFQRAFNANKKNLASSAADLEVDGDMGENTWGAVFDLYQYNMATELGEVPEGVNALRKLVQFLPLKKEWIGFGEDHPADGVTKDNHESQANRRVELLFFEAGQEPDLVILEDAPEITELYLKDAFKQIPVEPMVSAKRWSAKWERNETEPGRPGKMVILAPGAPPGTPIEYTVSATVDGALVEATRSVSGVSEANRAEEPFEGWTMVLESLEEDAPLAEVTQFPEVRFSFSFEGGGRAGTAQLEKYEDTLTIDLTHEPKNKGEAGGVGNEEFESDFDDGVVHDVGDEVRKQIEAGNEAGEVVDGDEGDPEPLHCVLFTPWGLREIDSDETGRVEVSGLPPGGARLEPPEGIRSERAET